MCISRKHVLESPVTFPGSWVRLTAAITYVLGGQPCYYRPQQSCEGYVFTPVCLSTGGGVCLSACWDTTPPPKADPSGAEPPREAYTPPADCYSCGRYASYWNAFLFDIEITIKSINRHNSNTFALNESLHIKGKSNYP